MNVLSFARALCFLGVASLPVVAQQPNAADPFAADATAGPFGGSAPVSEAAAIRENARRQRANLSPEEQIRFELNQPAAVTMNEETLENFVRILSEEHDIPMLVDKKSLEEVGLTSDTPITISLKGIKLRSLLRLALAELDLTYCIKNEVLIVTTIAAAEGMTLLATHPLPESLAEKGDKVLAALKTNVSADVWDSNGGPFTATTIDNILVVSASETVHEEVLEFLEKLNDAFARSQKAKR